MEPALWSIARDGTLDQLRAGIAGASVEALTEALGMAAAWSRVDAVQMLLAAGADPNGTPKDVPILRAMMAGRHGVLDVARALLEAGGDVDVRDPLGRTPLIVAAWHGEPRQVRWLVDHGADPNAIDNEGETALIAAARRRYVDLCDMFDNTPPTREAFRTCAAIVLEAGADPAIRDSSGRTAHDHASDPQLRALLGDEPAESPQAGETPS